VKDDSRQFLGHIRGLRRRGVVSVFLSVTIVSPAKTAEPIKTVIWDVDLGGPKEPCIKWGAHWRHLANMTEPSVCGGDAALCQITLTTCCHLHHGHVCLISKPSFEQDKLSMSPSTCCVIHSLRVELD